MRHSTVLVFLVLVALPLCDAGRAAEAQHAGKPAEYWRALANSPDNVDRARAIEGLKALGEVSKLEVLLNDDSSRVQEAAAKALGDLGPRGAPPLIAHLKADKHCEGLLDSLARIGRPVVPALADLLSDKTARVRLRAAVALGKIGPKAGAAVPALARLLSDDWTQIREQAARALANIGPDAKPAVPALALALSDAEEGVALKASVALGRIGMPAVPALVTVVQGPDRHHARFYASLALGDVGAPAVPSLRVLLSAEDAIVREYSADALAAIGSAAGSGVPALTDALRDSDRAVRSAAARALGSIGWPAEGSLAQLASLLHDTDERVRTEAKQAIARIRKSVEEHSKDSGH